LHVARNPWTDPDPRPGDFEADLTAVDPRNIEAHVGNLDARPAIVVGAEDENAERALPFRGVTAKEQLRVRIETLSEEEAGEALRLLDLRVDPVIAAFRDAGPDDELWTEDDEAAAAEGRADLAAGRTVSLDEALRESE
jgi:hypothetical protein